MWITSNDVASSKSYENSDLFTRKEENPRAVRDRTKIVPPSGARVFAFPTAAGVHCRTFGVLKRDPDFDSGKHRTDGPSTISILNRKNAATWPQKTQYVTPACPRELVKRRMNVMSLEPRPLGHNTPGLDNDAGTRLVP